VEKSPLAGIDANLLVALEALLVTESVAGAARRMGISESAMSHALARARELFDDPLLIRTGRRMSMTERARAIAPALREATSLLATAASRPEAFDPAKEQRSVRIAATDFGHSIVGPALYEVVSRRAPGVDLVFLPFAPSSLGALATGEVDLAISRLVSWRGYKAQLLVEEPFICVVRAGHPIARGPITVARFAALGHVLVSPGGRVRGAVDKALSKRGLARRVAYVSPTFLTAAQLVAATDLVMTCSERSAQAVASSMGLHLFRPPVRLPPFPQGMIWHKRQEHDRLYGWIRERIVEVVKRGR
jgi:DNA-binding transcriptional LysR family regulator